MTSQPSMGAIVGALARTEHSTNVDFEKMNQINEYWEQARQLYAPFESGFLSLLFKFLFSLLFSSSHFPLLIFTPYLLN